MFMYVWEEVTQVSQNYHDGGGIVVLADSLEAARALIVAHPGVGAGCTALTEEPDFEHKILKAEPRVFVFADAGCC